MTQFDDTLRVGAAFYGPAGQTDGGIHGIPLPNIYVAEFGAVATKSSTAICVNATATVIKTLSATGALATGGVATIPTPRNITITSTTNQSTKTFLVTGTDVYNQTVSEKITGPNATTVSGAKAFKTVVSVVNSAAITGNVSVGTGDVLGLPFRLATKGKILAFTLDGVARAPTLVTALATSSTSTATVADVRGTITATVATNGAILFSALMITDPSTKTNLYGVAPA